MKKLIELIKVKAAKGDVGIEIEVEGERLRAVDNDVWRSEDDGSLRGVFPQTRCEYILAKPIPQAAVKVAVQGLLDELVANKAKFNFSYRTSVHVHLNVQQLKFPELLSMMYAYYLLEEPLMNFCGKARKGNNFCLRLADAEGVLDWVQSLFENGSRGLGFIQQDQARYAAMNIEAITKYGSVEFRGMEGNMDPERINTWTRMLVNIRTFSEGKCPQDVYNMFMECGPEGFMRAVLGDDTEELTYARVWKDMEVSFSISIDLPFAYQEEKPVEKKDYWKYRVGEIAEYDEAVAINANGGRVEGAGNGMYRVTRKANKPVQIIMDDVAPFEFNEAWIAPQQIPRRD